MTSRAVRVLPTLVVMAILLLAAGSSAPVAEQYSSCKVVYWKHGLARGILEHGLGCTRARNLIRFALNHGMAKPAPWYTNLTQVKQHGYFVVARKHVHRFNFAYRGFYHRPFFIAHRKARGSSSTSAGSTSTAEGISGGGEGTRAAGLPGDQPPALALTAQGPFPSR